MAILKEARRRKTVGYRGKQAKTGNSLGIRFDKALFQSHPEFSGEVRAHVIAPGRMLVVAEPVTKSRRREDDPVMEAFLSFLAADMARSPQQIKPLDPALADRIHSLVGHLPANPNEDLGDEPLV
ncbi:MAG TPA: type II toxin-antitoxin system PrlF family antitoxin [Candidatus Solibacter sp.]|nr:type II toxin-antitoxin system PrlF family antitoxin [Candidatus Solibacter sp.]